MQLDIISPEATLFSGEVTSVTAPGKDGSFQILENHAPIVSVLQAGQLRIQGFVGELPKSAAALFQKTEKDTYVLSVSGGTLEMSQNKIVVLADA
ncbi:MAG: F0F1 ATP synthase subunit epsilon [Flavobacteriaceae bacterium]